MPQNTIASTQKTKTTYALFINNPSSWWLGYARNWL